MALGADLPRPAPPPTPAREAATEADTEIMNTPFVVPDDAVVRRTKDGWRVGSDDLPDLTCAMVLADLIAAEIGMAEASPGKPGLIPTPHRC